MNTRRSLLALLAAIVISVTVGSAAAHQKPDKDDCDEKDKCLTGTWTVKVTPPPQLGAPFSSIMTFTEDGNLIETANGGDLPALGNPGLGVWGKTGNREFAWTFLFFDYDISLQLIDSGKVRAKINLGKNGDKFTGELLLTIYDLAGNVQFSGPGGTVEGKRVKLEPLP